MTPYRTAPPPPPDPYLVAWDDLRQRRRRALIGPFALVAAGICALVYGGTSGGIAGHPFFALFALSWVLFMALRSRALAFRCPCCGQPFHRKGAVSKLRTWTCLHCGIEEGTPKG